MTIHLSATIEGDISGRSDGVIQGYDDTDITGVTIDSAHDFYLHRDKIFAYRPRWCIRIDGWERDTGSGAPVGFCNSAFGVLGDAPKPYTMYTGCPPVANYVSCDASNGTSPTIDPDGEITFAGLLFYETLEGGVTKFGGRRAEKFAADVEETDYTLAKNSQVYWSFLHADTNVALGYAVNGIVGLQAGSVFGPGLPIVDDSVPVWVGPRNGTSTLQNMSNEDIWDALGETPPEGEGFDYEPYPGILLSIDLLMRAEDNSQTFILTSYRKFSFGTSLETLLSQHCAVPNVHPNTGALHVLGCMQNTITYGLW